jgi:hypothetical protein
MIKIKWRYVTGYFTTMTSRRLVFPVDRIDADLVHAKEKQGGGKLFSYQLKRFGLL